MQNDKQYLLDELNITNFVSTYWQKKPCVIKSFIPDFIDPIDEHELAGLAQESDIDSRIISVHEGDWSAAFGPFDDFSNHCVGKWTLLVQGVDRYIQAISELSDYVSFIPSWRFDDVMVSYSVKGAGVGAHIDQYDVFIVQGKGRRRWQVGLPNQNIQEISKHPLLKLVDDFEPVIDYVLQPGDAIYIPPKHPHKGETIESSLNYSLGFRAPTDIELLHGLIDYGEDILSAKSRYSDPDIDALRRHEQENGPENTAVVSKEEIIRLKRSIAEILDTEAAEQALLKFISRQEIQTFEPDTPYTYAEVEQLLNAKVSIHKTLGLKPIYGADGIGNLSSIFAFYVDGNRFEVNKVLSEYTKTFINSASIDGYPSDLSDNLYTLFTNLATELLNSGYWYVDDNNLY